MRYCEELFLRLNCIRLGILILTTLSCGIKSVFQKSEYLKSEQSKSEYSKAEQLNFENSKSEQFKIDQSNLVTPHLTDLCLTEHRLPSMGTFIELQLVHSCEFPIDLELLKTKKILDEIESELSLYQSSSALVKLNKQGYLCPAPQHLLYLVNESIGYFRKTKKSFNIAVLPVLNAIEKYFAENKGKPPLKNLPWSYLQDQLDPEEISIIKGSDLMTNCIKFKKKNMALTLDGIAKGYAVDKVVENLNFHVKSFLINLSGNMRWKGEKPSGPWKIAYWNPITQSVVNLPNIESWKAISTSGAEHTYFDQEKHWHHLINPRTLRSAEYYSSVTVLGATAMECDVLSTALSVLETKEIKIILKEFFPKTSVHLIDINGKNIIIE